MMSALRFLASLFLASALALGVTVAPASALAPSERLADYYRVVLEREPDSAGLTYWSGELEADRTDIGWFVWSSTVAGEEYNRSPARFTSSADFVLGLMLHVDGEPTTVDDPTFLAWLSVYETLSAFFGVPTAKAAVFLAYTAP